MVRFNTPIQEQQITKTNSINIQNMKNLLLLLLLLPSVLIAQIKFNNNPKSKKDHFVVVDNQNTTPIIFDSQENILVEKAATFFADDIEKVSGKRPEVKNINGPLSKKIILVGTIGNNVLIDELIASKKLNVDEIKGEWEHFVIQTIKKPFKGVDEALVIVGSDRRGATYGIFTLTEKMGVSPWYWWADVPVVKSKNIYLKNIKYLSDGPTVKYRGIFINDEAPAFRNWSEEKFGGQNHKCYAHIFELLLRNRANYLWPAMWLPTIFNEDDPLNPKTADEYGIVISTSHHEPMMRSHNEWYKFDGGAWNYETNTEKLREFWRGGIERMGTYESVVTVGMRGDGDEGMGDNTAVDLLKTIIKDQREILEDVTGKPATETQQVWAVYKEVQDYYDKGMRPNDDVIILFCDDNWGNLRILPKKEDLSHQAGYGIYYHFDFVGGPVSYRWLNITQIERVWEQMNLAYQHGVKDLWIVNVGDIKPMELPINFFLDYAWNPDAIQAKDLPDYYFNWAIQQFGTKFAKESAELLALYTKYNARRTPEMLTPQTYSIKNYREADRIVKEYNNLLSRSTEIYNQIDKKYKSAFYQLVYSPIAMCATVNEMYVSAAKNKFYAELGATSANYYAERTKELFDKDAMLAQEFHELENGKWNHMMSQTHIGYTSWNNPPLNKMPTITYIQPNKKAELAYFIEYGKRGRNGNSMPAFDPINMQNYYVEIINKGIEKLNYTISAKQNWIKLSKLEGSIKWEEKVFVSIDWDLAPKKDINGELIVSGAGKSDTIKVPIKNLNIQSEGYIENRGVVAFEAVNFSRKVDTKNVKWTKVPNLGRTHASIISEPVNIERQQLSQHSARIEYDFTLLNEAEVTVESFLSPTQDIKKTDGLWFAISIDDEEPQIINMNQKEIEPDYEYPKWWNQSVGDHIKIRNSNHNKLAAGQHTLKVWMIDPGIVFQRFVIDTGGKKPSYLGAPQSKLIN